MGCRSAARCYCCRPVALNLDLNFASPKDDGKNCAASRGLYDGSGHAEEGTFGHPNRISDSHLGAASEQPQQLKKAGRLLKLYFRKCSRRRKISELEHPISFYCCSTTNTPNSGPVVFAGVGTVPFAGATVSPVIGIETVPPLYMPETTGLPKKS